MASPVNRRRRKKAFERGYKRPDLFNPYKNSVLDRLWKRGKDERLKKTGGVMPLPPKRAERNLKRPHKVSQRDRLRMNGNRSYSSGNGAGWGNSNRRN